MTQITVPASASIVVRALGDHRSHDLVLDEHFGAYRDTPRLVCDNVSQVLTLNMHERDAESLYWWLLAVIPALRDDRG